MRDQRIVLLATGPAAVHQGLMFAALSDDVTLLTHDAPPDEAGLAQLDAAGVRIVEGRAASLEGTPLTGVRLDDDTLLPADTVVVSPWMRAASPVLDALGLVPVAHPSGMGQHYPSEAMGATAVPGLRLAGNATDITAQVAGAAAAGALAGAALHGERVQADLLVHPVS